MKASSSDVLNTSLDDFEDKPKADKSENHNKKRHKSKKDETIEITATRGFNEEKENVSNHPKMNAFQFMMSSRHKSIGSNSPGREADLNVSLDSVVSKQELKARKSHLENWAERKGAAKRKREYEEIGNCINYKLDKREKKLKRMLNIDCHSDDEVITKRKKKCAVIDTDNENSNDEDTHVKVKEGKKWRSRTSLNKIVSSEVITERKKKCAVIDTDIENSNDEDTHVKVKEGKKWRSRMSLNKIVPSNSIAKEVEHVKLTSKCVKAWKFKIKLSMDKADVRTSGELISKKNLTTVNNTENEAFDTNDCVVTEEKLQETVDNCVLLNDQSLENNTTEEKRVLRSRKPKTVVDDEYIYLDSVEDSTHRKMKKDKQIRVAPVFLKAVPKAKLDPKVAEAKRLFLLSGVPSSLKKEVEKQQGISELEFDVFPTVSHVQQKRSDNIFWNLPKAEIKLMHHEYAYIQVEPFSSSLLFLETNIENSAKKDVLATKIKDCKKIIKEIKSQHADYPVYKVFNSIYTKSGSKVNSETQNVIKYENSKSTPKRLGRCKKKSEKKSATMTESPEVKNQDNMNLWTEKYKPKSSADIIGNHGSVTLLKEWLTNWVQDLKKNKKKYDSDTEFEITDDSCDSIKINSNTVILKGPTGSGKTAAVYAVCNELGFNVLEVNASSRRTGKRLLQEVQEATQSHQVCKKETALSSFVKERKEKPSAKMCVLLVEDVDVIFEQDEGFTAAISQIITTSKRPIILTTTDQPSSSIQKMVTHHQMISFAPLSSILTIWLQIVCLVEGFYVPPKSLDEFLSYNRGDIRRTLLQLQLYVSSDRQRDNKMEIKNETEMFTDSDVMTEGDNSNLSDVKIDAFLERREDGQIHQNSFVGPCTVFKDFQSSTLLHCYNLEVVWWNIPAMLNLPNFSKMRLERTGSSDTAETRHEKDKNRLRMLSDCYEALAFADVLCGQSQCCESLERRWLIREKDGLGLEENMAEYTQDGVSNELVQTLISRRVKMYKDKYSQEALSLNMAVPEQVERRWRSKQLACEEKLQSALSLSDSLGRKAIALDYMPCLRSITRSEFERAANTNKRGNRFYNYLRNLGVRCGDSTYKVACDVFKIWD